MRLKEYRYRAPQTNRGWIEESDTVRRSAVFIHALDRPMMDIDLAGRPDNRPDHIKAILSVRPGSTFCPTGSVSSLHRRQKM
jgi:hypothetical protein